MVCFTDSGEASFTVVISSVVISIREDSKVSVSIFIKNLSSGSSATLEITTLEESLRKVLSHLTTKHSQALDSWRKGIRVRSVSKRCSWI